MMKKKFLNLVIVVLLSILVLSLSVSAVDNGKIAFMSNRDGNNGIYVMNPDGTEQTKITNNYWTDSNPAWSPNGSKIVYESNQYGTYEIYLMNADGSFPVRITNTTQNDYHPVNNRHPTWSPNGSKIAFVSNPLIGPPGYDLMENDDIWVMNVNGSGQNYLTSSCADNVAYEEPAWSPDGSKIAFTYTNFDLLTQPQICLRGTQWTCFNDDRGRGAPAWSPDSSKIAFESLDLNFKHLASSSQIYGEIYVMKADGSEQPINLTNNPAVDRHPTWSPDGKKIAFTSDRDGRGEEIYVMNVDGTDQIRLTDTPGKNYFPMWSPIISPSIAVIAPNGGEGYAINHGYGIQWQHTGDPGQTVKIELLNGGILNTVLTPSTSIGTEGNGYYYWLVSPTQPIGDDYSIRISSTIYPSINDTSDAPFSINPYSGVLLQIPNGGETWQQGSTHTIHWDHYSSWHATTAELYLLKNGQVVSTLNKAVPIGSNHHGSYDWIVPQSLVPGNDYKIRIITIPGGDSDDSNASFTITPGGIPLTASTKIGVFRPSNGIWSWDSNGNFVWDGFGVDVYMSWGMPGDIPVVGDWNGDGKDDIGIFRPTSGIWSLDSNGNDIWESSDASLSWGLPNDVPVIGDWNGDNKDDIGIFRPSSGIWSLDSNGNLAWEGSDASLSWGLPNDVPVIGDWNGDNKGDIGIFRPSSAIWSLDSNGNLAWEGSDASLSWGLPNDVPVIGDLNGDNKDDIGIFRPSVGIWSLDSNGNLTWEGSDASLSWGMPNDNPVIGDWNGDNKDDIGIFRPSIGIWSVDSNGNFVWESSDTTLMWGLPNDKPAVGKY